MKYIVPLDTESCSCKGILVPLVIGYYMCVGIMKYLVPVNTDNFRGV